MKNRRVVRLVTVVSAAALALCCLSGCSSTAASRIPFVIGADNVERPEWVYRAVRSDGTLYETGYGKMGTRQASTNRAVIDAKRKMAEWIGTYVRQKLSTSVSQSDGGEVTDTMEAAGVQVAEAVLSGVVTEDLWADDQGGVWVLCSVPVALIERESAALSAL